MLSSKSWRQRSIAWAMLGEVPRHHCGLRNWVDKPADAQRSQMPVCYTGAKQFLVLQAKHAFMFAMVSLTQLAEKVLKWDDLGRN